ncbi:MAG TPA: RNA polymerase factor sigma-54 [Gallionella sp.]|jgi:RNA polymerase sigma-54 factor|nr:RNA polymerase factor sigma-54 [Gallionella sp.]OGS66351.1 MAG: RNA polymerase factor sigma-54 [Gallionellales bacterium GWA2_54_124]OGT19809.1 MAG: RNA polymerase factor sigma-54 [Gallionellales bacterium RIFOXYD12_FULL_53_10]HCI52687.1 RNA polymerase factor sigma-54 [Gallionella sp.]
MKASLQLRMSQQLTLTPQLQQSIRLLQLSTLDMQQEIDRMLDENPMLELGDESVYHALSGEPVREDHAQADNAESERGEDEPFEWNAETRGADDESDAYPEQAALQASMREYLHSQLSVSQLDGRDRQVIGMLIDALDENGYMLQDLAELAGLLPVELGLTLDDLETALVQLQYLDRPGLGARTLSECLALQLKALPEQTPGRELAMSLVNGNLDLLAAHDFARIKKLLRCSDASLRVAQELIVSLNPKPGCEFDRSVADYVVPDVIVEQHKGKWRARLNADAMPKLRVNQMYANILQQRDDKSGAPLVSQLQEASWLIKSLRQRFDTILRVAQAIVDRQGAFLEHGDIAMRPLVLREIADVLEMHESTVSRGTTQKFMRTPRGIYEFKYFFGSGLVTESGGVCSSAAIRELIKQLVGGEDTSKPLTDGRMSEILAQQGIVVARRTIAKYREALHILPVNLRKSL